MQENVYKIQLAVFTRKVSTYGVFFSPNTGKCGPEKTPYLDTFHAMGVINSFMTEVVII